MQAIADALGWPVETTIIVLGGLLIVEVGLWAWALTVLFRTPEERLLMGKRWPWVLIILLVGNGLGAIVFLVAGRRPSAAADPLAHSAPGPSTDDRTARAADVLYGPREGDPR